MASDLEDIVLLIQMKRPSVALSRLMERLPNDMNNARIYMLISLCYNHLNQFKEARKYIMKAASLDPNSAEILNIWGGIESKLGEDTKAIQLANRSLKLVPGQEVAHLLKTTAYLSLDQVDMAIKYAKDTLAVAPENVFAKNVLVYNEIINGKPEIAKPLLEETLNKNPTNIFALCNFALYKIYNNQIEEAVNILHETLVLAPNNKLVLMTLKGAISSKNRIARATFKLVQYASLNQQKIAGWIVIFYLITIGVGAFYGLNYPYLWSEILLTCILLFFTVPYFPYKIIPQLNHLILWKHPLGKLLLRQNEIVFSIFTTVLLFLGAVAMIIFFIYSHLQMTLGLYLIFLSTVFFDIKYVGTRKEKLISGFFISSLIGIGGYYYAIAMSHELGVILSVLVYFYSIYIAFTIRYKRS